MTPSPAPGPLAERLHDQLGDYVDRKLSAITGMTGLPAPMRDPEAMAIIEAALAEARAAALEEGAEVADEWADLAMNETLTEDANFLHRLAAAIRLRAQAGRG